jgi:small subunit ribosomal protein S16
MQVKIRLRKVGKVTDKRYNFKVVAIRSTASRDGKFIEELGYYDPSKKPAYFGLKKDRLDYWVSKGAQMSPTVATLLKKSTAAKPAQA